MLLSLNIGFMYIGYLRIILIWFVNYVIILVLEFIFWLRSDWRFIFWLFFELEGIMFI